MIEYENLHKANLTFFEEYQSLLREVFDSGWFILGARVRDFEKDFAAYNNVGYCSGVASGLDALTLSLMALELEKGSDVIVPSNTYIATILSIMQAGHNPVLVEPDLNTYNIDPLLLEQSVTKKTRAVMIVHLYGQMCEMDHIIDICRRNKLFLIEDCAQAHGAVYKGKKAGSFGNLSAFSFYPTKNLGGLGDGGAVLTDSQELDKKVKMLRNYGSDRKYYNKYIGLNSRLDEVQALFLSIKLKKLEDIINHKRRLAQIYSSNLKADFTLPVELPDSKHVFHIYNVRHERRDQLKEYLIRNGIGTEIHYPLPPHRQEALKLLSGLSFPVSEKIHNTTLSLPISYFHTDQDIYKVVEFMNKF